MEHKGEDQTSGESRLITGSRLTPVFMGGVCGGIVQSFVVAPFELLKVNQQVRGGSAKDVAERLTRNSWRNIAVAFRGRSHGVERWGTARSVVCFV